MAGGTGPIELPDDQRVAIAKIVHSCLEPWPARNRAGCPIFEDSGSTGPNRRVELQVQFLFKLESIQALCASAAP